MAQKQNRITQLRKDVDKLRKSYTGAMSSANKAVADGIERLADHELAAIKKHYEAALKNLKSLRKGGDPRDLATEQLRLLQDTIDRIISNARESLKILEQTRDKIAADVRKEISGSAPAASKKPAAKKAPAKRKTPAKKTATAKKAPAKKTAASKSAATKTTAKPKTTTARKTPAKKKTTTRKKAPAKPAAASTGSGS